MTVFDIVSLNFLTMMVSSTIPLRTLPSCVAVGLEVLGVGLVPAFFAHRQGSEPFLHCSITHVERGM